jgi:hypothetical protein
MKTKTNKINKNNSTRKLNKKIIKKYRGGSIFQDKFRQLLDTNNVLGNGNYIIQFQSPTSLNFKVNITNMDGQGGNNLNNYFIDSVNSNFNNFSVPNLIKLINLIDIIAFIQSIIDKRIPLVEVKGNNSVENLIIRTLFLLNRERLSDNIYLDGENILSLQKTLIAEAADETNIDFYILNKYMNLLQQIQSLNPTISNSQLFYILFLSMDSTDKMQLFMNNFFMVANENIIQQNIGQIILQGSKEMKNEAPTNIITYINNYQRPINKLFKLPKINYQTEQDSSTMLDNPERTIIDYIYNLTDIYIKTVNGEIIHTSYKVCYLILVNFLETTTGNESILLGIFIQKINSNITRLTIDETFEFNWVMNTRTQELLHRIHINDYLPFLNGIEPIFTSKMKKNIFRTSGIKLPNLGFFKRPEPQGLSRGGKITKRIKHLKIHKKKTNKKQIKNK